MTTRLDHLVVAAATLAEGVAYLERTLGVTVPFGGEHPAMGTHNHLMRIGERTFLELIAITPEAAAPSQPRWFGLDDPHVRHTLTAGPRLLTWVAATDDLEAACAAAGLPIGKPMPISRGELTWQFAVPEDGRLLAGGMLPNMMQWPTGLNAAERMANLFCRLAELVIHHPHADWLNKQLALLGLADAVAIRPLPADGTPHLVAHLETPTGPKELTSLAKQGG